MISHSMLWIVFNVFVLGMLALDLGVFHRRSHVVTIKEALIWTGIWVALSLVFCVAVYFSYGSEKALQYLTGYLIEKSLSVDNIFVFLLIFTYFGVQSQHQHKVLFWGILGALFMRAFFIFTIGALISYLDWIIYIFGAFLIYTGIKMWSQKDLKIDPSRNPVLRLFRKIMPVTPDFVGEKFFTRYSGKLMATPLFIVILVVETTDVVFAVDSIPAIFAVSNDPFIVYSSNVFAILGLRALFFALAGIMELFYLLHYALSAILAFVGIKMLITHFYQIPTPIALSVVGCILLASVIASILFPKKIEPRMTTERL